MAQWTNLVVQSVVQIAIWTSSDYVADIEYILLIPQIFSDFVVESWELFVGNDFEFLYYELVAFVEALSDWYTKGRWSSCFAIQLAKQFSECKFVGVQETNDSL